MNVAYIALGSNIEPRKFHLDQAITRLRQHQAIAVKKQSPIYETKPVGYADQGDFLNMVLEAETSLDPEALLDVCQQIEQDLGRKRIIPNGPRTIDLDILAYNHENIKTDRLIVPHPRMHERAFVLAPLHDIAPNLILASVDKRVAELWKQIESSSGKDVSLWTQNGSGGE
ncbi:2-amino-4-hydroxy-6-hydroxymethyldihydropteridine diphosphokinase [Virgibacillus sp. 179-BFC.A HS]|uniref:2-amino-4-hydroxy-6-hydroxymethyldihydropteridine diphosphokinase n=1 Tax=Tigheibacillus jepli TaxID=3035914 RepID=A0ABU5CCI9_9BACI|nr:2-amino-4-hydroxy-6-hydroxymethyldihydropteridine diphosphokinase [Virgibacillus sp. 179-BFC.A HS]MDY0404019.1 2-amino-4-hydroxy-6-hydroxymethyldihydropteridine diphosphokinase [Virgibacillus sp. 179-BFC.A HS]